MLAQYQQGCRGLFGWWGKPGGVHGEKPPQSCTEQANHVDIAKHKCRDIGLPDGMGIPNRQAAQEGMGQRELSFRVRCIIQWLVWQTDF